MSPRALGLAVALATLILDQANKLWLIFVYGIEARQPVTLAPFFDMVFAKNPGISYSLFTATTEAQRWLLLAVTLAATAGLAAWLWRTPARLVATALGFVVGGALGNGYDRFAYGFVADFYHFHVGHFSWYIFNLADVAIVVGVALLLLDSLVGRRAAAPQDAQAERSASKMP